ncbi:uncharacterized protein LOC108149375 [Drosophila elegans]|uniref:uncharacterized protein LOC108149375 n=1 Tax=Drosophila elegans TaxID=30023 RepID=UPI0007E8969C|nr:uncharacterized protein LOC108149375 [Drosophila elegans]
MLIPRTIFFLALLLLARSDVAERNTAAICEFFQHVQALQDDQWEDSVNLMKRLLGEMVTALLPYPEYGEYKDTMLAYLERGKAIVRSSSMQEKIAYFRGFNEGGDQPMLTGSPAKKEELTRPLINFRSNMIMNVYTELHKKLIKAADELERVVSFSDNLSRGEPFILLDHYRKEGMGVLTENIATRILEFKELYQCV